MKTVLEDKPAGFPTTQVNGAPLKPITQALLDRRATSHFKSDPVPDKYLNAILRFAGQAPSGYNLQPWRFVVVRQQENRLRLKKTAMNQEKVGEAPVVVIAFAVKDEWKKFMDAIFHEGVRRGFGKVDQIENVKKSATEFLDHFPAAVWLNRHTMIAFTTMMLVAEAYGLDTAPMEGFDPEAVKREFGLPAESEVIALLAIGFAKEPDKAYAGRLALEEIVHHEKFGSR
ncbi:MAG: nitroreductase family protein [Limisphaerales bacterium]